MAAAFDAWLRETCAATGGFTALLILLRRGDNTIWPLGSSWAHVIGNDLNWPDLRRLLDRSGLDWDAVAIFPVAGASGGPLADAEARRQLKQVQDRVIADHAAVNDGAFFDRKGRPLRLDPA